MTNELPAPPVRHHQTIALPASPQPTQRPVPLVQAPVIHAAEGGLGPPQAPGEVWEVPAASPVRQLIKIARTSQRAITLLLWKKQGGLCPLCGKEIDIKIPREGVMDHDHDSGEVRGILHLEVHQHCFKPTDDARVVGGLGTPLSRSIRHLALCRVTRTVQNTSDLSAVVAKRSTSRFPVKA